MIYLYIEKHQIKILYLKKAVFGQFSAGYFTKEYAQNLTEGDSIDYLASAIKEALMFAKVPQNDVDITLILPPENFSYTRFTIPSDITSTATESFIESKVKTQLGEDVNNLKYAYQIYQNDTKKIVNLYGLTGDDFEVYKKTFSLLDLKLKDIIPASISYFQLFDKTLRKTKEETIFYLSADKDKVAGYLFDSFGLLENTRFEKEYENLTLQESVKEIINQVPSNINRIMLGGMKSKNVRQDTFTKEVGVWTNMLFRIITGFYEEELKMVVATDEKPFPFLDYAECFGAFIFSQKNESFFKGLKESRTKRIRIRKVHIPWKSLGIFILSFVISFSLLYLFSKRKVSIPNIMNKPTLTPTAIPTNTPTPTPAIKKSQIKIKILNGSGKTGLAGDLKDKLIDAGYKDIVTGNAKSFDYKNTVIQFKSKKDEDLMKSLIEGDLKSYTSSYKTELTETDTSADVIIIAGKDIELEE